MIKLKSLLVEKTLYHGTISDFVPSIKKHGLLPTVGEFVKHAYAGSVDNIDAEINEYLKDLVFATDKKQLDKAVTAITAQVGIKLNKDFQNVTDEEFKQYGALAIIKDGDSVMSHYYPKDDENYYGQHPLTVEPGDYFSDEYVNVDYILTKDKLISFLRRLGSWPRKYGPDYNKFRIEGKLAPESIQEIKKYDIKKHYNIDMRPNTVVVDLVNSILKDIKPLIYELGFRNIKINYVTHDTEAFARYNGIIDSTGDPIITMSTKIVYGWVKKYGHKLDREIERVIVHELNHAYLELCGLDINRQYKDRQRIEPIVEDAAQEFVEDRNVQKVKETLDEFVEDYSFHTGHIAETTECPRCNGWKVIYVRAGIPNVVAKCPVCVDKPKTIKVYRGVSEYNKKYGNFWTTDKEWARQFTQAGLDKEIKQRTIDTSVIMKRENVPLPRACSDKGFDQAIKDAEFGKFDAFWVNEGQGEPPSIYVMNLAVLK
jgi:hypothetical protein